MPSLAGAVILPDKKKTVLFKNRDLQSSEHKDEIFYDVDCFGVRGIDVVSGKNVGLAIGVNRNGLAMANTHVKTTDTPSFHVLSEQILMFARDAEDGLGMVVESQQKGRMYQWGNVILADKDSLLAIEIADGKHTLERSKRKVLRSSHHIMLDTKDDLGEDSKNDFSMSMEDSEARLNRGYELLRNISDVSDVFALLGDHGGEKGQSSICRHSVTDRDYSTGMSYLIEIEHGIESGRPKIVFHVAHGNPCEADYRAIPIVFPADEEIMKRANQIYHHSP
jgi:hypothetical protein